MDLAQVRHIRRNAAAASSKAQVLLEREQHKLTAQTAPPAPAGPTTLDYTCKELKAAEERIIHSLVARRHCSQECRTLSYR